MLGSVDRNEVLAVAAASVQADDQPIVSETSYLPASRFKGLETLDFSSASLYDTDSSETLTVTLSDIPVGAIVADGEGGHTFTADADTTAVDVSDWTWNQLTITPPPHDADAMHRFQADLTRYSQFIRKTLMRTPPDPASLRPRDLS